MLTKNRVKQVKLNQLMLVKEFLFHKSDITYNVRNENLLKSIGSEIIDCSVTKENL